MNATQPQTPALSVHNLSVSYESNPVLRSIAFSVEPGLLVGIIGPNGAGKSTLLKATLGLIRIDNGQVRVFDQPIDAVRRRVAYVPQTGAVDWDFPVTVLDVVLMGRSTELRWKLWPGARDREKAFAALERVGMADYSRRHIRRLSGGQQQRVFLARALCQGADLMLLDEPFAGVDAATERAIFNLIDALTNEGRTVIVVNHDLSILSRFDRVVMVNQRLIAFGPPEVVVNEDNLKLTYGGRLSLLDRAEAALRPEEVVKA
ncbi:MAG: ATP-binding cassette domain-containing protein [Phycisphaera sp.]|nr:ATP-binding cassette domain-containing protein [Phycisphaera sp.]